MMRIAISLAALVAGVLLVIFGLNASHSAGSAISNAVSGAPSNKSLLLLVLGVLCLLYGGVGTIFNRK